MCQFGPKIQDNGNEVRELSGEVEKWEEMVC